MIRRKVLSRPAVYPAEAVAHAHPANFYTQLDALFLDDDWVDWAVPLEAAFCPDNGRPTDPVVFLKIFLIGHFENLAYDTALAERIHDSLALRAFLRYDLTEATPDHATISRVRAQVAEHVNIDAVLDRIVARCAQTGLVSGALVGVDTTLVPANASLTSLVSRETGQSVQAALTAARAADPQATLTVSNDVFRSTTDPDARIRLKEGHPRDLYYSVSHVTDGRAQIILAARADTADFGEPHQVRPACRTAAYRLQQHGCQLGLLIGDTGFDDGRFHREMAQYGWTPVTNYKEETGGKPPGFQLRDFTYDAVTNSFRCPHGQVLPYKCTDPTRGRDRYVSTATTCAACPGAAQCLSPGAAVRWLARGTTTPVRDRVIARGHTPLGRAALRARKHIVEPPFGYLKTYGGFGLINCRGRDRAHVKTVLAAVAWNLLRLVRVLRTPRRPGTPVAASLCRSGGAGLAAHRNKIRQRQRAYPGLTTPLWYRIECSAHPAE